MSETEAQAPTTQEVENAKENVNATETVAETKNDQETKENIETKENVNGEIGFKWEEAKSVYDFTVKDIDGNEVSLSKYQGKPTLIVNVASNCGFTKSNYNQLNELYDKYEGQGLRIAAFPCNQFMNQESACEVDIKNFAEKNNVKFDMYSKIAVNGSDAVPLYRWLKSKQKGILGTTSIKWNFTKFLIDKDGIPIKRYAPTTAPNSIEPDIKSLVA